MLNFGTNYLFIAVSLHSHLVEPIHLVQEKPRHWMYKKFAQPAHLNLNRKLTKGRISLKWPSDKSA